MIPITLGSVAVILPAAGGGQRFGRGSNKLLVSLVGKPLWTFAAETLLRRPEVGVVMLAIAQADRDRFEDQLAYLTSPDRIRFVIGGEQRSDTVAAAIAAIDSPAIQWVAIHDAARPLLRDDDITAVFDAAAIGGAAILASPITGTLKREPIPGGEDRGCQTVDRRNMYQALTPQVFHLDLIRQAYARHRGRPATDDAELVERIGHPVRIVPGSADNLKITYPEDLRLAEALMLIAATQTSSHEPPRTSQQP